MRLNDAIQKLETSNDGITLILQNIDDNFEEIRTNPRLQELADDLEHILHSYLKAWKATNTEILEFLKK